jgi:hypothetical protein
MFFVDDCMCRRNRFVSLGHLLILCLLVNMLMPSVMVLLEPQTDLQRVNPLSKSAVQFVQLAPRRVAQTCRCQPFVLASHHHCLTPCDLA